MKLLTAEPWNAVDTLAIEYLERWLNPWVLIGDVEKVALLELETFLKESFA